MLSASGHLIGNTTDSRQAIDNNILCRQRERQRERDREKQKETDREDRASGRERHKPRKCEL